MTAFFEDTRIELDADELRRTADRVAQIGPEALIGYEIGKSAFKRMLVGENSWLAGQVLAKSDVRGISRYCSNDIVICLSSYLNS